MTEKTIAKRKSKTEGKDASATTISAPTEASAVVASDQRRDVKLGYLMHDISRMRRSAFDQLMKPLGVTRSQWWILAHLSRHDGMMQTQLADLLEVGKASLGALLDRLEAGGLIERRADPSDRRAKRVLLTKRANQLLHEMDTVEKGFNDSILNGLSDEDRNALYKMLKTIKSSLSAMAAVEK